VIAVIAEAPISTPTYSAYGGVRRMFVSAERELLFDGPAGTGKTRGLLEKVKAFALEFPGMRILLIRATRKSMTESVLVTWEDHVLTDPELQYLKEGPSRGHRDSYTFSNGSHVVLGGMDKADRIMSTEYDLICYFEATEGTLEQWEKLITRLRNRKILLGYDPRTLDPRYFAQIIADCNPGTQYHWLHRRWREGKMRRCRTTHDDNPTVDEDYLDRLRSLSGVRRKRLLDGLWVAEEGQIWECWSEEMMIHRQQLLLDPEDPEAGDRIHWRIGAIDWGHRNAGVMQVWGVDGDSRMYREAEVYHARKGIDWWAEQASKLLDKYDLSWIVADPSRPDLIEYMNDCLGPARGREEDPIVIPADNALDSGLQMVRERMERGELFLCWDALQHHPDADLGAVYKPATTEEEIPAYVWKQRLNKDSGYDEEKPDPRCDDHGCDAMRYAAKFVWGRDLTDVETVRQFPAGSIGDALDHQATWDKIHGRSDADYTSEFEERDEERDWGY